VGSCGVAKIVMNMTAAREHPNNIRDNIKDLPDL
jgi:hypothetical protein